MLASNIVNRCPS